MNAIDVVLTARSFASRSAMRRRVFRHRRLVDAPVAVVLWQLGAEPFSAAAIGWGDGQASLNSAVAGEPRNRDLAVQPLLEFANWFNPLFERHFEDRETIERGNREIHVARNAPQVIMPNAASIELLGRLGRRLAYSSPNAEKPVDSSLVQLGRHLAFLHDHAGMPGQQLIVAMTDLMDRHWVTAQSPLERQSLAAFDAFIAPPCGVDPFEAAAIAEESAIGPVPDASDERRLEPVMRHFNEQRSDSIDPKVVRPLLAPIAKHYQPLVRRAWEVLWNCRDREATFPEARSVERRWLADREAYTRHIGWLERGGLRRIRQTARQAARRCDELEQAVALVAAEEACDDPLVMAPYILASKAIQGIVTNVDGANRELVGKRRMLRPRVTLRTETPCGIPPGREIWWTEQPAGREFVVESVLGAPRGGYDVSLKLLTSDRNVPLPRVGNEACFSILSTSVRWRSELPGQDPWTHRAAVAE